jgi:uncharacterized membrane protein YciS (DUF1049 family)
MKLKSTVSLDRVIAAGLAIAILLLGWLVWEVRASNARIEQNRCRINENRTAIRVIETKLDLILKKLEDLR